MDETIHAPISLILISRTTLSLGQSQRDPLFQIIYWKAIIQYRIGECPLLDIIGVVKTSSI